MPLIPCPDCSARVSAAAPSCPKCGRPLLKVSARDTMPLWIKHLIMFIIIALFVGGLIYGQLKREQRKAHSALEVQRTIDAFSHR